MTKKTNIKNFIWNALGLTLNSANSFFLLMAVRYINGLDIAGIFTYAFALCALEYTLASYYNRSFQVSETKNNYSFNDYLSCRAITSIISLVLLIVFAIISHLSVFEISVILSLSSFRLVEVVSDCFYGAIQKKDKLYQTGISLSIKAIIGLITFIVTDYLTSNLIVATTALATINLIIFFIYDLKNFRKLYQEKIRLNFTKSLSLFKSCFPILIFSALAIFLSNCQKYILPLFVPDDIQAIFGILIMPATVLGLIGAYLINPFINIFSSHHQQKKYVDFAQFAKKILLAITGIGAFALIICHFAGIPLLQLIFQLNLSEYQLALELIILASIFYAIALIISSLLTILNENRRQTYIYLISAISATISGFLLIPSFGIYGAVYSFLISSCILTSLYVILLQLTIHKAKHEK